MEPTRAPTTGRRREAKPAPRAIPGGRALTACWFAIVALIVLAAASPAFAAAPEDGPAAARGDGAIYAGEGADGRLVTLVVERGTDGTMALRILQAPPALGEGPGLHLSAAGRPRESPEGLLWSGEARRVTPASPAARLALVLPLLEDGALDPFGVAEATVEREDGGTPGEEAAKLRLEGVATLLHGVTALADGSLRIERHAPFFHGGPWRDLDVVAFARMEVDRSLRDGLEARRAWPEVPMGAWYDERTATVESLSRDLLALRVENHVYTGGAHPNTHLMALNLRRGADGEWRPASPCEAIEALGRVCDLEGVREAVIRDLARQEAAWVVDGQVTAGTPWLLDLLTLTPTGVRVDFAPYAVGPYAQGVFTVHLPFDASP